MLRRPVELAALISQVVFHFSGNPTCVYLRANGTGSFEGNGRAPYPSVLRVRFLPLVTDFHYFFKSHPSRNPFSLPDLYLTVSPLAHPIRITK